jgi:hypothetical protein
LFFEATRTITNGAAADPDPAAGTVVPVGLVNDIQTVQPGNAPTARLELALEAPVAETVTLDLWIVRESNADSSLTDYPANRFYLLEAAVVVAGGTRVSRAIPRGGKIYARMVSETVTADRSLYMAGTPDQEGTGSTGGASAVSVTTLPGPKGNVSPSALALFTNAMNTLAMRQYLTADPVITNTQLMLPRVNDKGHDMSAEQWAAGAEDNVNNVFAIASKPVVGPTYAVSKFVSAALATNHVAKATPGMLYSVSGRLDIGAAAATYYLLAMDAAALPANGAVTILWSKKLIMPAVQVDVTFEKDFRGGVYGATGLVFALSTTEFTLTISAAASLKLDVVLFK